MEVQDTVMEARGLSDVNTVDTTAPQPRYSLRSTDKVNRRESSVTKVDPHHCAIAETEKQHSSPQPPPHSPDLTYASRCSLQPRVCVYVVNSMFVVKILFTQRNINTQRIYRTYILDTPHTLANIKPGVARFSSSDAHTYPTTACMLQ